jgi:hypothetical protein
MSRLERRECSKFSKTKGKHCKSSWVAKACKKERGQLKTKLAKQKILCKFKFIDLLFLFLNQEHLVSRFIPNLCRTRVLVPFIRDFTNIFIACNLNWIQIPKLNSNTSTMKFKFNWKETRCKLVQKVLKICLWLWCWKKTKKLWNS